MHRYPRELAARPLLLPAGLEGTADLIVGRTRTDTSSVDDAQLVLGARFRAGPVEIELGVLFFLARDPSAFVDPEALQSLAAIVRYGFSPDHTIGLAIERNEDRHHRTVAALYQRKLHLAPRAALEGTGFLVVDNHSDFTGPFLSSRSMEVGANVRAVAQLTGRVAVDAHASYGYDRAFVDNPLAWSTTAATGVGTTVAITPSIDASAAVDVFETGAIRFGTFTLAVAARSIQ